MQIGFIFIWIIKAKYQVMDLSELKRTRTEELSAKSSETVKYGKNSFQCPKNYKNLRITLFCYKERNCEKKLGQRDQEKIMEILKGLKCKLFKNWGKSTNYGKLSTTAF